MKGIKKEIKQAIKAVKKELKAVREQPSTDVLKNGAAVKNKKFEEGKHHVRFPTRNQSIQYAEKVEATAGKKTYVAKPVQFNEEGIVLAFEKKPPSDLSHVEIEWINDFVLKRLLEELEYLKEADAGKLRNIKALWEPGDESHDSDITIYDDGLRNTAQRQAIKQALQNRALFIWGPPGTGKTSTLGYIIANLMKNGKKVLFASNTNRAVDIGMISVINALQNIGEGTAVTQITRYGDVALESEGLEQIHFEKLMDKKMARKKQKRAELKALAGQYTQIKTEINSLNERDEKIPDNLKNRFTLLRNKVEKLGGEEAIEADIEVQGFRNERAELKKYNLVGTTLARVCASELFGTMAFDAVVIDEASMANLPYLLVLASKAKKHIVAVGDPMQLPPIALTNDPQAQTYLEKDIFTQVSGARSAEDLFAWHDAHPDITAFFNTQYRLKSELAGLISSVFYDNRLKSAGETKEKHHNRSVYLLNSSNKGPFLTKKKDSSRFRPVNAVHLNIMERLVHKLVMRELVSQKDIGIIVPFRSSVYDVRDMLKKMGMTTVEVGTIHTYQGREKRVIIFDTVMSGEKQGTRLRHYSVRPFDEAKNGLSVHRLLNVAFSRSKSHLYVLADMNHIRQIYQTKFLGKLLKILATEQQMVMV